MADYTARMKAKYDSEIVQAMTEKFGYKNRLEVPKLEKITLNMGVGEASQDKKKVQTAAEEMALIAGQKPAFDRGGMIQGGSRMADQVPINALPGEAVLSRQAVRAVGGQTGVDALNRGEGQNSAPIVLPVYKHFGRFVRDELERSGALQRATFRGRPVGALGY